MNYEEARDEIERSIGSSFDPIMTEIMLVNIERFEDIHRKAGQQC